MVNAITSWNHDFMKKQLQDIRKPRNIYISV